MQRNEAQVAKDMLYKGQVYTFLNGNVYDADPTTGIVEYQMKPGDNLLHIDTGNGIPTPPAAPETVPSPVLEEYPIAAAPVDVILPERGAAAGQFYTIVGQCVTEPINIYDDGTKTLLGTLNATGAALHLYCDGLAWYENTMAQLLP